MTLWAITFNSTITILELVVDRTWEIEKSVSIEKKSGKAEGFELGKEAVAKKFSSRVWDLGNYDSSWGKQRRNKGLFLSTLSEPINDKMDDIG